MWYLKGNISCDVHLLNELLETDVPWDDAIVVWAGKLRKLWDSLSEMRSSLCERRLERTVLRPALLPVKNCAVYSFFPSGITSHSKIAQFNWECIAPFRYLRTWHDATRNVNVTCTMLYVQWRMYIDVCTDWRPLLCVTLQRLYMPGAGSSRYGACIFRLLCRVVIKLLWHKY